MGTCNFILSAVCSYLLPPLGVYWRFGCGLEFCICLVLTILGYVPGLIYAVCVIGFEAPERKMRTKQLGKEEGGAQGGAVYGSTA
eukprot:CAMPEP_0115463434 /NCGR_PEP_ID=MMETSP0271-20121206/48346_1 /TAXON_ID=71861 /ORGANISM="Scrippsiella trochoidea, Strain CCMP3099" /LENGTH=84 /DNA_ID=CAMNT_0002890269 /DNA_START=61 /DNA_END=315 /DNA_ORIENTATION=+